MLEHTPRAIARPAPKPRIVPWLLLTLAALLLFGCSSTNGSIRIGGVHGEVGHRHPDDDYHGRDDDDDDYREPKGKAYGKLGIPPGHLPRPGYCRVWYPGRAPGRQPRAMPCDRIDYVPAGAWLLRRSHDHPEHIRVEVRDGEWDDHERGRYRKEKRHGRYEPYHDDVHAEIRIYDAESGVFIRVELP